MNPREPDTVAERTAAVIPGAGRPGVLAWPRRLVAWIRSANRARLARRRAGAPRDRAAIDAELRRLRSELERARSELARREAELRSVRGEPSRREPRGPGRWLESLRRRAAARRILASGLFDPAYYRATYGHAGSDRDAARHFVKFAATYGLNPHPMFDTAYYLAHSPELKRSGANPLLHFIAEGAARGLRPHPRVAPAEYLAAAASARSARARRHAEVAGPEGREAGSARDRLEAPRVEAPGRFEPRTIAGAPRPAGPPGTAVARTVVVSHVLPYPPRAGNEYRIHRYVRWLQASGHDVHLVVSPLPGESPTPESVRRAAEVYPNLVVCERDGVVSYRCERPESEAAIRALAGKKLEAGPAGHASPRTSERIAAVERTFCPPSLLHVLSALEPAVRPDVVIANYVFTSACLAALRGGALRVIDTHDVFSTKAGKVLRYGIADDLALSAEDERAMLLRADLVVAIQPDEERELQRLVPERRVVTAGVDFDVAPETAPARAPVALYVASSNPMNVKGVRDFLALAWPIVRGEVPGATLRLVGPVCDAVDGPLDGVELLGRVDRLEGAYAEARVVINPSVAGTGLKIKTLEALAHARPVVTWPSGVDGLGAGTRRFCRVATDWYAFAREVARALSAGEEGGPAVPREELARHLSADAVYAALREAIAAGAAGRAATTGTAA